MLKVIDQPDLCRKNLVSSGKGLCRCLREMCVTIVLTGKVKLGRKPSQTKKLPRPPPKLDLNLDLVNEIHLLRSV